jgi:hypothetical protein
MKNRDGIFKLLRKPEIDFKESIPPAYEGLVRNLVPLRGQESIPGTESGME